MLTYLSEQIVSSEGRMPAFTAKVAFLVVLLVTARSAGAQELNTRESDATVKETVQRLEAAIEERGAAVVDTVDHAANAASVDSSIPAATLVIFGNPALCTALIAESPTVALDLPQRMLVWDDEGTVRVGYEEPVTLAERHGIDTRLEAVAMMTAAMDALAAEAAGSE